MGISQEVYTIFGWEVEVTGGIRKWLEQVDYNLPEGVLMYGMDCTKLMVGPHLFYSGDARWEPLEGFESFTEDLAQKTLDVWLWENKEVYTKLQVMCKELKFSPKFFTFVNYS